MFQDVVSVSEKSTTNGLCLYSLCREALINQELEMDLEETNLELGQITNHVAVNLDILKVGLGELMYLMGVGI